MARTSRARPPASARGRRDGSRRRSTARPGARSATGAARVRARPSRICCGLTASTTTAAPSRAAAVVAGDATTPGNRAASRARCSAAGSTTWKSGAARPRASMPPMSAVAMLPPPMKVMRMRCSVQECRPAAAAARRSRGPMPSSPVELPPGRTVARVERRRNPGEPATESAAPGRRSARVSLALNPGYAVPRAGRAPKIALPTRTMVAPSAIAASRSADMPIDSVSTGEPGGPGRVEHCRNVRNCERCRATSARRLGDPHQPAQPQAGKPRHRLRQRHGRVRRDAALGRLPADVDLNADVERRHGGGPRARQPFGDRHPVDRLHPGEALGRRLRLVALQRPDQVPLKPRQVGRRVHLRRRLLHVVLAEGAQPERVRRAHRVGPERLAHRQHGDGARVAASRRRRPPDARRQR